MQGSLGRSANVRWWLAANVRRPALWAAVAAVVGGLLGVTAVALCLVPSGGSVALRCSLDQFSGSVRLSRVLTTLSLLGVCALLTGLRRSIAWTLGAIVALLVLVTLFWFVAGNSYADMPTGRTRGMSGTLLYASIAAGWGRPILMAVLGTALLWARRWLPALLLLALGASEMPPIRALIPDGVLYGEGWPLLLLGSHEFGIGPGLVGGVAWVLLGVSVFFSSRRLERERLDERRRALAEENSRKALRLYERAFGAGDLSVVDELLAPDFLDRRRSAAARRSSSGPSRICAAPSPI